MALICFASDPEAGARALAPSLADMVRPIGYPEMYPPEEEGFHPTAVGHTMFLDRLDTQAATTILECLQASDAPMWAAQLRVLGGAVAGCPTTPPPTPTGGGRSWSTWPPSTRAPTTAPM